jgi:putative pyruvate formate lyase activating enzyme
MKSHRPGYVSLYESGELFQRINALNYILKDCALCPRKCGVDRLKGERGACRTGALPVISDALPHFGEEAPLSGYNGSGTVFLTHCNLGCVFCQNHDISHGGAGDEISIDELSQVMIRLQRQGCHNINFVSPTHQAAQIVESLPMAIENGLDIPLVYNCGGYEDVRTLKLLEGIFDIYMPDIKYSDDKVAFELSGVSGYFGTAKRAVIEMQRQVGDLVTDSTGVAVRGLIIRHLVLPEGLAGTMDIMRFIAREVSVNAFVNIMDQYRPCFRAHELKGLSRRITEEEFEESLSMAASEGLRVP